MDPKKYIFTMIVFVCSSTWTFANNISVVTTIKPIHSLVSAVMENVQKPQLLIDNNNSPHGIRLKPSQIRVLNRADIIFYIDHKFETFLLKHYKQYPDKYYAFYTIDGLNLHPVRNNENWEACNDHAEHHEDHHHHHAKEQGGDMHIWLSLYNGKKMVDYIADILSDKDPDNAVHYQKNAAHYKSKLDKIDFSQLIPLRNKPFIVFHDAYQYFEKEHQLSAIGAITPDPQLYARPSNIAMLRQKIKDTKTECVFKEPQFSDRLVNVITAKTAVKTGILDPIGYDIDAGSALYIQLLQKMRDNFVNCFM